MRIGDTDLVLVGKRLYKEIGEDDVSGSAAELAYRFFLALFPFFIFLAALGGFAADLLDVENPTEQIMDELGAALPADAASVLSTELEAVIESRNAGLISIGIIGAIWAASSGIGGLIKAMNIAYEVKETRPIWQRYGLAVGLTLLGGVFIVGAFFLLVGGQFYGMKLASELGIDGAGATLFTLGRWPLVIMLLLIATAFIYWAGPNIDLPFRLLTPGAVVFAIGWILISYGFGLYVANFGSYNATYGTLGGVVMLLVWFYLTGLVLLIGAELNAVLAQEVIPEELPARAGEATTSETVPDHKKGEASGGDTSAVEAREPAERKATTASNKLLITVGVMTAVLVSGLKLFGRQKADVQETREIVKEDRDGKGRMAARNGQRSGNGNGHTAGGNGGGAGDHEWHPAYGAAGEGDGGRAEHPAARR
jgi:membrane protein